MVVDQKQRLLGRPRVELAALLPSPNVACGADDREPYRELPERRFPCEDAAAPRGHITAALLHEDGLLHGNPSHHTFSHILIVCC